MPLAPAAYDCLRLLLVKPNASVALKNLPAGAASADSVLQRVSERGACIRGRVWAGRARPGDAAAPPRLTRPASLPAAGTEPSATGFLVMLTLRNVTNAFSVRLGSQCRAMQQCRCSPACLPCVLSLRPC